MSNGVTPGIEPPRPISLLTVMSSLMGGGAERQMTLLLRHLDRSSVAPELCLLSAHGELLSDAPDDIPITDLGKRSSWDLPRLVVALAAVIRRRSPDIVFSKLDYTNIVTALAVRVARKPARLVLGEESVQSRELAQVGWARSRRHLLRSAYISADAVIVPSPGIATDLETTLHLPGLATHVIPNMVDVREVQRAVNETVHQPFASDRRPLVVTAGRLAPSKGHRHLLEAFAVLNGRLECNLAILGEGPERGTLERLATELGIRSRVTFMGFVRNPFAVFERASVFVSASKFESFGNVLIEAMAAGCPVVSTRVPYGPTWLIEDGVTGLLVTPNDASQMAERLESVITDRALSERLRRGGTNLAARYDVTSIVPRYGALFRSLATSRAPVEPRRSEVRRSGRGEN